MARLALDALVRALKLELGALAMELVTGRLVGCQDPGLAMAVQTPRGLELSADRLNGSGWSVSVLVFVASAATAFLEFKPLELVGLFASMALTTGNLGVLAGKSKSCFLPMSKCCWFPARCSSVACLAGGRRAELLESISVFGVFLVTANAIFLRLPLLPLAVATIAGDSFVFALQREPGIPPVIKAVLRHRRQFGRVTTGALIPTKQAVAVGALVATRTVVLLHLQVEHLLGVALRAIDLLMIAFEHKASVLIVGETDH